MNPVLAIAERELKAYFVSPIAYVVIAAFLLMSGFFFSVLLWYRQADLTPLFVNMAVILLFVCPGIAMRLLAEDNRQGTLELLLTSPVSDTGIVLGKFLASIAFLAIMLSATLYMPIIIFVFGKPEPITLLTGYLGLFLTGACYLAVGLLASSLTKNQIVAFVVSFGAGLLLWLMQYANTGDSLAGQLFNFMSLDQRFNNLSRGLIDTTDLIYLVSFVVVAVFLTTRSLESRRWR